MRDKIRSAMRRNELEVLAHLRTHNVWGLQLFGKSWFNAFCRLDAAGRITRFAGYYKPIRNAKPVTGAR